MRFLGEFASPPGITVRRGETVILRTDRGLEAGEVLCPATSQAIAVIPEPTRGDIVRIASPEDSKKLHEIRNLRNADHSTSSQIITQHRLAMQLVDIERIFGGERMVFYFISESRVDFRELVKTLAREFHTRIELRQIGVRDEAKLLADYGDCGKPVCCNTHMVVMPPVSMRMAKLQKSTLDPSKISGRCGRLKCCLRFEQDAYEEFQKELPPVGSRVVTSKGQGRRLPVSLNEVLTRL
jgi:cell fate regulator YaaT (PSP1 superfamily)